MGEVYRAADLKLEQQVALKCLPPATARDSRLLERFRGEVRIARQISHRNVCRVYDLGEIDGVSYISMEYVDGEDLASLLRRIGRLPGDKALEFARRLCAGLEAAHEKGVLHRDLKPANIMIDGQGQVRIRHAAIGVNFVDTYQRSGLYPMQLPAVAGNEGAGVIEAVGAGVTDLKAGDRVCYTGLPGSYCETRLVPADRLPDGYPERNNPFRMLIDQVGYIPGDDLLFGSDGMPHGIREALRQSLFPPYAGQTLTLEEFVAGYGGPPENRAGHIETRIDRTTRQVACRVVLEEHTQNRNPTSK